MTDLRTETRVEATIPGSADDVWARIRDFGNLDWYPGVERCRMEGDVRIIKSAGIDLEISERLLELDDRARTFSYTLCATSGSFQVERPDGTTVDIASMVGHHTSRFSVTPIDDSHCTVAIDLMLDRGHDEMLESTAIAYGQALEHLRAQVEA